jgi:hypothetical protein
MLSLCREDKDTSAWLLKELQEKLLAHSEPITIGSEAGSFQFSAVDTCEGTSSVVYVRQKVSYADGTADSTRFGS